MDYIKVKLVPTYYTIYKYVTQIEKFKWLTHNIYIYILINNSDCFFLLIRSKVNQISS